MFWGISLERFTWLWSPSAFIWIHSGQWSSSRKSFILISTPNPPYISTIYMHKCLWYKSAPYYLSPFRTHVARTLSHTHQTGSGWLCMHVHPPTWTHAHINSLQALQSLHIIMVWWVWICRLVSFFFFTAAVGHSKSSVEQTCLLFSTLTFHLPSSFLHFYDASFLSCLCVSVYVGNVFVSVCATPTSECVLLRCMFFLGL